MFAYYNVRKCRDPRVPATRILLKYLINDVSLSLLRSAYERRNGARCARNGWSAKSFDVFRADSRSRAAPSAPANILFDSKLYLGRGSRSNRRLNYLPATLTPLPGYLPTIRRKAISPFHFPSEKRDPRVFIDEKGKDRSRATIFVVQLSTLRGGESLFQQDFFARIQLPGTWIVSKIREIPRTEFPLVGGCLIVAINEKEDDDRRSGTRFRETFARCERTKRSARRVVQVE